MIEDVDEAALLHIICQGIREKGRLEDNEKERLSQLFSDRFERAMKIIEENGVIEYLFKPSKRIVWTVKGKNGVYQVMPTSPYCSCDDFYFRVLSRHRGICYHLLAQSIAVALNKIEIRDRPDTDYSRVITQVRPNIEKPADSLDE